MPASRLTLRCRVRRLLGSDPAPCSILVRLEASARLCGCPGLGMKSLRAWKKRISTPPTKSPVAVLQLTSALFDGCWIMIIIVVRANDWLRRQDIMLRDHRLVIPTPRSVVAGGAVTSRTFSTQPPQSTDPALSTQPVRHSLTGPTATFFLHPRLDSAYYSLVGGAVTRGNTGVTLLTAAERWSQGQVKTMLQPSGTCSTDLSPPTNSRLGHGDVAGGDADSKLNNSEAMRPESSESLSHGPLAACVRQVSCPTWLSNAS